jgi:hypothetical protein
MHWPVRLLWVSSAGHRARTAAVLVVRLQETQWWWTLHKPFAALAGAEANADVRATAASMTVRMVFPLC